MKGATMKKIPTLLLAAALSLPLSAPSWGADSDEVAALIEQADAARKRAAEAEFEWRFTGKHIKDARKALESGDLETAHKKAERALFEAERAIEQAEISETTWMLAVPK